MYGTGLSGGVRAIFEVANRLHERGYNIRIIALGDYHGLRLRFPYTMWIRQEYSA